MTPSTLYEDLGARAERSEADASRRFDRAAVETAVALLGIAALAVPRRTRPLAGVLYGVALSRVHSAADRRIYATITRLFDERQAVSRAIDRVARIDRTRGQNLEQRLEDVERVQVIQHVDDRTAALDRIRARVARADAHDAPLDPSAAS
jgi:hypothetical protein